MSEENLKIVFDNYYIITEDFDEVSSLYTELDRFKYSKNNFNTFFSQGD